MPGTGWNAGFTGTLPEPIVFGALVTGNDPRAAVAFQQAGVAQTVQQVPPIVFYPDGTSSDAVVVLRDRQGRMIQVTLRGLTGMAQVTPVRPGQPVGAVTPGVAQP